ncbi:DUF1153 domain-containing protein [Tropicimonas sp.]|uniref:CtrA inhibitor SciP n=1 Tax=Tropicimonas sp. TaxID=2067044 RepID=UPI003A891793
MFLKRIDGPRTVTLPDGSKMTRADLPPKGTRRWVASRKAAVVKGVLSGLINLDEAIAMYGLSKEEFESWTHAAAAHGISGLKTTRLQRFRRPPAPPPK